MNQKFYIVPTISVSKIFSYSIKSKNFKEIKYDANNVFSFSSAAVFTYDERLECHNFYVQIEKMTVILPT